TSANIANVKIEYTTNNGTNWSTITASIAAATGSYAWTVPANATAQAKIKISDVSNNLINDQSNAAFTITVGTLALTAPNGGEVWVEGRSQNITWTSSNVTNVKLEYSSDNGTNWNTIIASTAAAAGSYSWNMPGVASSQALVKVTDADHASLSDVSNGVFTLRQCNTPDWTFSPVGYQYTMNIVGKLYFEGTPSDHLNDKVAVYVGNQLRGTARVSFLAANTYRVYMTVYSNQASGENLLFQAWDSLNCKTYPRITQEYTFTSNAVIGSLSTPANLSATETLPTLSVTSPNGGEGWIAQTTQNITWASSSVTNIKIEYSTNNGSNWSTISSSTPASTGTYAWAVPTIASTQALVRLTNLFDTSYSDASNAAFSLLIPSVSVTAPNGGETDTATGTRNITWTSSNVENVKIEYSSNNGSSWNTITASTPANAGSYAWTVPTIATTQVLVKVSDASNANFADTSDAVSAIVIPAISVTSPNGGESYASTFSQNIAWTSSNTAIVKIEYSSNNGTDWNTISAGTAASAGTYAWTIPSITSTQVLVRISNANFLSFTDTSDAVFSIFLPAVTLTAPNGGESWNAAASQNITWTSSNVTNVKLEYSTNNGSSWSTISASTAAAAGTYAWTVPSVSTLQALVKISDAAYSSFSDMSDAVFTIQLVDRFYMHSGWTWVSFNKRAANMSVSSVLTGLTPTANDLIKDQTTFAQYVSNDEWFGSLDTIRNTSAYLINMANQDSMDFAGQSILPESTPIAVSAGWNYVAYVPQSTLSIGSALASLDVRNEDLVKNQFAFAIYDSLYGWAGDMQQMQPKQGYFLKSTLQNTLTYPAASKSATPAALAQYQMIKTIAGQPEWTLNIGKYPYSMSVIAQLDRTIIDTVSETTVLGVFRNNECRGFAKASYSEITKSYVFYVSVYGEASAHDSLKFRVYNGSTNSVIPVANGIVFEANSVVGKLRSPYGITNSTVAVQKELEIPAEFNLLQNYPNPFNPSTTIGYSLPQESDVHIAVYNVLGQKVKELVNEHKSTGNYSVVWDGTNNYNESVSSGIYIYMIKAGNHQMVKKMTFLK
ncbi:MAG: T9SS type A sorting domain-containing protein, partial [Ignavibacteriales bacterium]|nr:T9SS type A sorting domain-containing protein [Ignavibacteriales bacterium]